MVLELFEGAAAGARATTPTTIEATSGGLVAPSSSTATIPVSVGHSIDLGSLLPTGWDTNGGVFARTLSTLLSNPYFSAGAGLWVLTVGGAMGRQASLMLRSLLKRRFVVSMEMSNQDASYEWMMRWLASQPNFKVRQMSVLTRNQRIYANDRTAAEVLFGPCPNVKHWFLYGGRPVSLMRRRVEQKNYDGDIFEALQFTTWGTSSTIFEDLMVDAQRFSLEKDSDRTVIYTNGGGRWTRQQDPRPRRPLESVILSGDMSQELLADVRRFLISGAYYRRLGVPYRRGYLLHGPPGCGKTSYVMALAGELRLSICLLSLSNRGLHDEALMSLLNSAEMHSIVLMEDIDRAFSNDSSVTMSGLLNALDGVAAQEGRLVFMTTNHVERLDAALIRPGRADVKVAIDLLDRQQALRMYAKFFPTAPASLQDAFAAQIPPQTVSAAQIQAHLFFYRDDPKAAIDRLEDFLRRTHDFERAVQARRNEVEKMRELPRAPLLDQF